MTQAPNTHTRPCALGNVTCLLVYSCLPPPTPCDTPGGSPSLKMQVPWPRLSCRTARGAARSLLQLDWAQVSQNPGPAQKGLMTCFPLHTSRQPSLDTSLCPALPSQPAAPPPLAKPFHRDSCAGPATHLQPRDGLSGKFSPRPDHQETEPGDGPRDLANIYRPRGRASSQVASRPLGPSKATALKEAHLGDMNAVTV